MDNFKGITELRYWCQKVLPLVYDDSLSYYELLGKITKKLNDLIENNMRLPDYIQDLIKEYISSGAIGEVVRDILTNYMLNVKNPPKGLKPATGDGTADDTEAIQGCIDYANANGGKAVYFPSGVYLSSSLDLKDNVSLFGFDCSTTRVVLKGGATRPLINGVVNNATIKGLSLDGNMDIQVNNVDLVKLTASNLILSEIVLHDGYNLMDLTATGDINGNNIRFTKGVVDALKMQGVGVVMFNTLTFEGLSSLNGRYAIHNTIDNAIFDNIYSKVTTPVAIYNNSSNSVFVGKVLNSNEPIEDVGTGTYTNFYQRGGSLDSKIDKEIRDRKEGDALLTDAIEKEVLDRIQGITDEQVARENRDNELQQAIDKEKQDREEFDDIIGTHLNTINNNLAKLNKNRKYVSIENYGVAVGGDISLAIKQALEENDYIYIPEGNWYVDVATNQRTFMRNGLSTVFGSGIDIYKMENKHIWCDGNIVSKPTTLEWTQVLNIQESQNIFIYNMGVVGDRYSHDQTSKGEWAHGIGVYSSDNVHLENVKVSATWGDGIYTGIFYHDTSGVQSGRVYINNPIINDISRNGISLVSGHYTEINNAIIRNVDRTLPMAGIDIEAEGIGTATPILDNVIINNLLVENCKGHGVDIAPFGLEDKGMSTNIKINNYVGNKNRFGMRLINNGGSFSGDITINDMCLTDCVYYGVWFNEWGTNKPNVTMNTPTFINCNTGKTANPPDGSCVGMYTNKSDYAMGNIFIKNPRFIDNRATKLNTYAIWGTSALSNIENVIVDNPVVENSQYGIHLVTENGHVNNSVVLNEFKQNAEDVITLTKDVETTYFDYTLSVNGNMATISFIATLTSDASVGTRILHIDKGVKKKTVVPVLSSENVFCRADMEDNGYLMLQLPITGGSTIVANYTFELT